MTLQTTAGGMLIRATMVGLSPLVGWALARLARRFRGAERVSAAWMAAGATAVTLLPLLIRAPAPLLDIALGWALLMLIAIDITALRLPDLITLPLAGAGLALSGFHHDGFAERLVGLLLGFGVIVAVDRLYFRFRGRVGVGLGDAKLFAAAGAWLGWRALPSVLLLACAGGLIWVALRVLRWGREAAADPLPFGAPVCAAMWIAWLTA